jgi:uncharacterized protein
MEKAGQLFMPDQVQIIRRADCPTTHWSGGTTTELYIYPPQATYRERNFSWRLSTATVADEQSTFTSLPGVTRTLLLLNGKVLLSHAGHYQKSLHPFSQDTFQGDWQTTCYGKATDFNLMTRQPYRGKIATVSLKNGETCRVPDELPDSAVRLCAQVIYIWQGSVQWSIGKQESILHQGDVGCLEATVGRQPEFITLTNRENMLLHCIVATVYSESC